MASFCPKCGRVDICWTSCIEDFPHVYAWGNNEKRAALKGRRCRILARGRMRSILVEFENGEKVVTSERAVKLPS